MAKLWQHKIWLDKVLSLGGSVAMYVCWLFASHTHTHKVVTIEIIQSLKQSILIPGCQAVGILFLFFEKMSVAKKDNATSFHIHIYCYI